VTVADREYRRHGFARSRRNIAYHYDLGNELFELMLDETMTYSCALFERPDADGPLLFFRGHYRHLESDHGGRQGGTGGREAPP
jgi:cyclopropane fatty-acyl-phospholipid synthase-like methyltransferase